MARRLGLEVEDTSNRSNRMEYQILGEKKRISLVVERGKSCSFCVMLIRPLKEFICCFYMLYFFRNIFF